MQTFKNTFNPTLLMDTAEELFEYMLFEFVRLCRADSLFQEAKGYTWSQEHLEPSHGSPRIIRNRAEIQYEKVRAVVMRQQWDAMTHHLCFHVNEGLSQEPQRRLTVPVYLSVEDMDKARENALAQVKLWVTVAMICLEYRVPACAGVLPGFTSTLPR